MSRASDDLAHIFSRVGRKLIDEHSKTYWVLKDDMDHKGDPWAIRIEGDAPVEVLRDKESLGTLLPGEVWGSLGLLPEEEATPIRLIRASERPAEIRHLYHEKDVRPALGSQDLVMAIHRAGYVDPERFGPPDPILAALQSAVPSVFEDVEHWVDPEIAPIDYEPYVPDGKLIFPQRSEPQGLFLVGSGLVRLFEESGPGERVYALLRDGALFGELERPLAGRSIPTMLGARAGVGGIENSDKLAPPKRTSLVRIPFSTFERVCDLNPDVPLQARLSNYTRWNFWNWWPMLRAAATTGKGYNILAAVFIRYALAQWRKHRDSEDFDEAVFSHPPYFQEYTIPEPVDMRDILMLATGCTQDWMKQLSGSNTGKGKPILESQAFYLPKFLDTGIIELGISDRDLPKDKSPDYATDDPRVQFVQRLAVHGVGWNRPQWTKLTIKDLGALEAIATGRVKQPSAIGDKGPVVVQERVTDAWNSAANYWSDKQGTDGDPFRRDLLNPIIVEELGPAIHGHILDAGCGEGVISRVLIKHGAGRVTGWDVSTNLIERARSAAEDGRARFEADALHYLYHENEFDAVVCNLVLMDLPYLDQSVNAVANALKCGAIGVWTVIHPDLMTKEGEWWLDPFVDETHTTCWPAPTKGKDEEYEFSRLVQMEDMAPATPYFRRSLDTYRTVLGRKPLKLVREYSPPLPPDLKEELDPKLHRGPFDVDSPVVVFVTKRRKRPRWSP